jgi:hypothetical protein
MKGLAAVGRLSDVATSYGSVSKVVRLLLQSMILGLGAYLVIRQELTTGRHRAAAARAQPRCRAGHGRDQTRLQGRARPAHRRHCCPRAWQDQRDRATDHSARSGFPHRGAQRSARGARQDRGTQGAGHGSRGPAQARRPARAASRHRPSAFGACRPICRRSTRHRYFSSTPASDAQFAMARPINGGIDSHRNS